MGTAVMGKAKGKGAKAKPAETRVRNRAGEKPTVVTIKGNPEWRDWVDRGAKHCRTDVAKLIDAAVVDYLRARGFSEEAPER
jgi:hypothetical protein